MKFEGERAELLADNGYNLSERRYIGDPKARAKAAKIIKENKVDIYDAIGFSEGTEEIIKIFAHVHSSDKTEQYNVTVYFKKIIETYEVVPELSEDNCPNYVMHNLPKDIPDKHVLAVIWTAEDAFSEICNKHGLGKCRSFRQSNKPSKDTVDVADSATGLTPLQTETFLLEYEMMRAGNRMKKRYK